MSSETYARAKAIVLALQEFSAATRLQEAHRMCAGDELLLAEVRDLLAYGNSDRLAERFGPAFDGLGPRKIDGQLVGRTVGRYFLEATLGAGGMGVVFTAIQEQPRRSVALKILRGVFLSERALRRFEHEIEVLGRLTHPNIAQVYEAGIHEIDGQPLPYFAMELVRGARPIDEYCRATRPTQRAFLELFLQACDALDHGHAVGVVHRDVKPGNVLVDANGRVKVIDFGIACTTNLDLSRTSSEGWALEGTLGYMSPEQCDGDRSRVGSQIDVYALGVVLYELLCGQPPYVLDGLPLPGAISTIREREPVPPHRIRRALRGDIEAIMLKCLEKDPRRRYSSAGALATDVRRHLAGEGIEARAPGTWRRATRWAARRPWATTMIALGLLAGVIGATRWIERATYGREPAQTIQDGSFVRLMSRAGDELASWHIGEVPQVISHMLYRGTPAAGRSPCVLLAVHANAVNSPWSGQVCAFDTAHPEEALWTSEDHPLTLPDEKPLREEVRMAPIDVRMVEIFESAPGPEFLVIHREVPYSACAVRIYGADGTLHYEAWHEGAIGSMLWLAAARRVIITAADGEAMWTERSIDMAAPEARYPLIIAALEPIHGRSKSGRFMVKGGQIRDETLRWIRWLGPADVVVGLGEPLVRVSLVGKAGKERIEWVFFTSARPDRGPVADLYVHLQPDGALEAIYAGDHYRRWQAAGWVPEVGEFRLLDYQDLPAAADSR